MTADPEDSPETTEARHAVLDTWGAEIRERLRLAEIALVPEESRKVHWPGPGTSPLMHLNRPSVSRETARKHSAQTRHANKADKAAKASIKVAGQNVLEMPLNAPPVRHDRSIVTQLANRVRANMKRENPQ